MKDRRNGICSQRAKRIVQIDRRPGILPGLKPFKQSSDAGRKLVLQVCNC